MPESSTSNRNIVPPSGPGSTLVRISTKPSPVNLTAFDARASNTWRNRAASPNSRGIGPPGRARSSNPLSAAWDSRMRTVAAAISAGSNGAFSNSNRFASMREKSRMSSTITINARPDSWIVSAYPLCASSSSVSRNSPTMPRMPLIGVRISWVTVATNSDLARVACSAASRASSSSRRIRLCSDESDNSPARTPSATRPYASVNSRASPAAAATEKTATAP